MPTGSNPFIGPDWKMDAEGRRTLDGRRHPPIDGMFVPEANMTIPWSALELLGVRRPTAGVLDNLAPTRLDDMQPIMRPNTAPLELQYPMMQWDRDDNHIESGPGWRRVVPKRPLPANWRDSILSGLGR